MKFNFWRGQTVQPFVSVTVLIFAVLILGNFTITEWKLPILILLAFQLLYALKKGALLAGKKLHIMARNSLTVIVPVLIFMQEFDFYTFETNVWIVIISIFALFTGMAFMGGSEKK